MNIKNAVKKQYQVIIDEAGSTPLQLVKQPKEGWITCTRKALGMSAAQLGRIVGHTRANISASERSEKEERVTLQTLKTMAEAMGCKLVYGIVPVQGTIDDLIRSQARKKAMKLVGQASTHMALEKQSLTDEKVKAEVTRVLQELIEKQPANFWSSE